MTQDATLYRIDLHVHYKKRIRYQERFHCQQVDYAIANGLSAIAFTEHHQWLSTEELQPLRERMVVYSGVEVTVNGCGDFLIYGPKCDEYMRPWTNVSAVTLIDRAHWLGGAVCLAHPMRKGRPLPSGEVLSRLDGIEAESRNTPREAGAEIREAARQFGIQWVLCNSDSHKPKHTGLWFNEVATLPQDDVELVEMLRRGKK